jgi:hypothetical protein
MPILGERLLREGQFFFQNVLEHQGEGNRLWNEQAKEQLEFSMNQAGRRNVTGIGNSPIAFSMIVC